MESILNYLLDLPENKITVSKNNISKIIHCQTVYNDCDITIIVYMYTDCNVVAIDVHNQTLYFRKSETTNFVDVAIEIISKLIAC